MSTHIKLKRHSVSWKRYVISLFVSKVEICSFCSHLECGLREFRISAPQIWNLLPASIRNSPSLPTFHRHLKTHYFRSAYPNS